MKKQITLTLISAFLISFTTNADADVKQGDACKKIGAKTTIAGNKYICKISGKKLIWKKGEIVKPTTTPTHPSPSNDEDVQNIAIFKNSLLQIRNYANPNINLAKTFYVDSRVSPIQTNWIEKAQDNVLSSMGGLLGPSTHIFSTIAFDAEYANDTYSKIESITGTEPGALAKNNSIPLAYCSHACAFSSPVNGKIEFPSITYVKPMTTIDGKELGAHETFHIVQNSLDLNPGNLPCWIHEGQATLVGSALADPTETFDSTIKMIRAFGGMHSAGSDLTKIEAPQGWNGGHGPCMDVGEYQVGRIANAFLVGKFGWQKSLDFLTAMNGQPADGNSWKVVFEKTFSQPVSAFYVDADPFINWFFSKYIS